MKNSTLLLTIVILALAKTAGAANKFEKLTLTEKELMVWAIEYLASHEAMTLDKNQCRTFDPDLIKELKKLNLLQEATSKFMDVCPGSAKSK